jgi:uncharacterized protein (DUF1501 family)
MSSRNNKRKGISRRKFLGQASCALVGSTTFLNSYLNLGMMSALAKPMPRMMMPASGDYKASVCILLAGGNDSFNMIVPTNPDSYSNYASARSNLALPQGELLPLNFTSGDGQTFGLHPAMPELQGLFNDGKAAFIANVGTMVQPTTKEQAINETVPLPLGLLSHSDQIKHWQTGLPQQRSSKGWGGRMADILHTLNDNQNVSMSISLSGVNTFQTGNDVIEFAIENSGSGSVGIQIFEAEDPFNNLLSNSAQSLLDQQYTDLFKQTYRDKVYNAQAQHEVFSASIEGVTPFATQFTAENPISQNLHMIAKSIAAHESLGHSRQTYFLTFGGWDHHDELLNNQNAMLSVVSQALSEFQAALEEINMSDCVTTFTISDFGRALISNGNGTDHAWGGNTIVMGGAVNGGQVYGQFPDLALGSANELGNGIILPSISADEYFAEIALWMGVQTGDMEYILPNLDNFVDINEGAPIGFLNI